MIHDLIGVGFGPSNIALAVALEEAQTPVKALFLERSAEPLWHDGMLLDGSDIQHNFLRDFITPVNPRSHFSFTNYLHESGRFFEFLNLGRPHALRRDFFNYVQWVANQFKNVCYGEEVCELSLEPQGGAQSWRVTTASGERYLARALVLGIGRNLNIPPTLEEGPCIAHLSRYLHVIKKLDREAPVAVLGASQSAVELLLDLRNRGFRRIHSIHRSFSYRLKDTSPFSDEVYLPEFIEYYHALPHDKRAQLDTQVRQTNYSCADRDVIDSLYSHLYEDRLNENERILIHRNHEVTCTARARDSVTLRLKDIYTGAVAELKVALLILATGYLDVGRNGREGLPRLLRDKSDLLSWDEGYLNVERDYRVRYKHDAPALPDLYLNGLCESSHGMGDAGSFSLVSLRARDILKSIVKRGKGHASRINDLRGVEETLRLPRGAGV